MAHLSHFWAVGFFSIKQSLLPVMQRGSKCTIPQGQKGAMTTILSPPEMYHILHCLQQVSISQWNSDCSSEYCLRMSFLKQHSFLKCLKCSEFTETWNCSESAWFIYRVLENLYMMLCWVLFTLKVLHLPFFLPPWCSPRIDNTVTASCNSMSINICIVIWKT